ncbi:hypothetical protein IscW_ISCW006021 [Ixodes scapularis]|uniref:Uncharacterized protein n=1 Tax=Ixodes scapularis TaxID=6945 RepID=B7PNY3_IXOSC|nr:hypothetical protein IscW_ISCW006021 [Ixodes scapularis]|eukprot:XP_002435475.1 hypothetical protein IscW_ISCW006021 [Ixodes scapularis]
MIGSASPEIVDRRICVRIVTMVGNQEHRHSGYQCIHEIYLLYKKISYSCTTVHLQ